MGTVFSIEVRDGSPAAVLPDVVGAAAPAGRPVQHLPAGQRGEPAAAGRAGAGGVRRRRAGGRTAVRGRPRAYRRVVRRGGGGAVRPVRRREGLGGQAGRPAPGRCRLHTLVRQRRGRRGGGARTGAGAGAGRGRRDPHDRGALLATVAVECAGVATSGTAERGGHARDPRTGAPATGLASVTVVGAPRKIEQKSGHRAGRRAGGVPGVLAAPRWHEAGDRRARPVRRGLAGPRRPDRAQAGSRGGDSGGATPRSTPAGRRPAPGAGQAEPDQRGPGGDLLLGRGALGPAAAEEADRPVHQRGEPVLEADQVEEVDRQPQQPGDEPGQPDVARSIAPPGTARSSPCCPCRSSGTAPAAACPLSRR